MMKENRLIAQNELSIPFMLQFLHKKRLPILIMGVLAWPKVGAELAGIGVAIVILLLAKVSPIKIAQKEDLIHLIVLYRIDSMLRKLRVIERVNKLIMRVMAFSLVILMVKDANGQQETIPPPPPPPPPPVLPAENQQVVMPPQIIQKTIDNMTAVEIDAFIKSVEIKELLIRQQYKLKVGGSRHYFLKDVNMFTYHPDVPILFNFDKNIRHVLMLTASGKAIYEDNYLFLAPPGADDGKVFGFVVVFEDGTNAYFSGERVSFIDNQEVFELEKKTRKVLDEPDQKKKDRMRLSTFDRSVVVYYRYTTGAVLNVDDVIAAFLRDRKRCPVDGEMFATEGKTYKFIKKQEKVIKENDEVYACGFVFRIVNIR